MNDPRPEYVCSLSQACRKHSCARSSASSVEPPASLRRKFSYLRLVASDQLSVGCRVLRRDGQGNEGLILDFQQCSYLDYCPRSVTRHMIM